MEIFTIMVCVMLLALLAMCLAAVLQRQFGFFQTKAPCEKPQKKMTLEAKVVGHRVVSSCIGLPYTEYEVVTELGKDSKTSFRRFRQFHAFHKRMLSILPAGHPALENFPSKRMLNSLTAETILERRKLLDNFLANMVSSKEGRAALGSFCDLPVNLAPGLPIEQADLIAQAEIVVDALVGQWSLEKEKNGLRIYSQRTQDGRKAFKSEVHLDASMDETWNLVADPVTRRKWDKTIADGSHVETFGKTGHDVIQYATGSVAGGAVSPRHFVVRRKVVRTNSIIMCIAAADGLYKQVSTTPGAVRVGKMAISQKLESAKDGRTKYTEILKMDPGGNLPAWLVDSATATELQNGGVALLDFISKSQ